MAHASDRVTSLRLEKLRTARDHAVAEVDLHRHRALVLLAVFLTMALSALASVGTGRLDAPVGGAFTAMMAAGAGYALFSLHALPSRLRDATQDRIRGVDTLIAEEEE